MNKTFFINSSINLGSKFFKSDGAVNIGLGLEVWRGYHQSVRPAWKRVLLNIDVSASVFLQEISVLDYLREVTNHDLKNSLSEVNKRKFAKKMKGMYCNEISVIVNDQECK